MVGAEAVDMSALVESRLRSVRDLGSWQASEVPHSGSDGRQLVVGLLYTQGAAMDHATSQCIGLAGTLAVGRLHTAVAAELALRPYHDIGVVEAGRDVCRGQPSRSLVAVYSLPSRHGNSVSARG